MKEIVYMGGGDLMTVEYKPTDKNKFFLLYRGLKEVGDKIVGESQYFNNCWCPCEKDKRLFIIGMGWEYNSQSKREIWEAQDGTEDTLTPDWDVILRSSDKAKERMVKISLRYVQNVYDILVERTCIRSY